MEANTLNPEQIKAWRSIIFTQLEQKREGAGMYALIMPESEVIAYWRHMKPILENPQLPKAAKKPKRKLKSYYTCKHSNSFTGSKGKYCIDCEEYV